MRFRGRSTKVSLLIKRLKTSATGNRKANPPPKIVLVESHHGSKKETEVVVKVSALDLVLGARLTNA